MSERSPWGGFEVLVVPDDDGVARRVGFPDALLSLVTQESPVVESGKMYVRATLWRRIKAEFDQLGQRH